MKNTRITKSCLYNCLVAEKCTVYRQERGVVLSVCYILHSATVECKRSMARPQNSRLSHDNVDEDRGQRPEGVGDLLQRGDDGEGGGWIGNIKKLPGLGILLVIAGVLLNQTINVVVKKTAMPALLLLLWRDGLRLAAVDVPLLIYYAKNPFPKGQRLLLVVRGIAVGTQMAVQFYAVKLLPLPDFTMINCIKPAFVTLLSCIFLKEPCGLFEVFNLILVFAGITFVIQPQIIFGTREVEYTPEMMYAVLALVAATILGSLITIILRHLRKMHWAPMASSVRFINLPGYLPVVLLLSQQCLPACGQDRVEVLALMAFGFLAQVLGILSLKVEEAHVVSLVDNAVNIVTSFVFQAVFFFQPAGMMKIVGALIVLSSVLLIGGTKIWKHKRKNNVSLPKQ